MIVTVKALNGYDNFRKILHEAIKMGKYKDVTDFC